MTMAAKGVAKLIEECGELQQVLGKKLAWWDTDDPHWDGSRLDERMAEEIGDVMAACEFVASMFGIHAAVTKRRSEKLTLFARWHLDEGNNAHGIDNSANEQETVVRVLRQIAEWGPMSRDEWLSLATEVERADLAGGWTCPMCQEVPCDDGCPLETVASPATVADEREEPS